MTDELIKRLRGVDDQYCHTAADALEAQAAEIEQLRKFKAQMVEAIGNESLSRFIEKHGNPVPIVAERDAALAEVERLKADIAVEIELRGKAEKGLVEWAVKYQNLQAKLDAMQAQKPIGCGYVVKWEKGDTPSTYETGYAQVLGVDVYASPVVQQPLTVEQIDKGQWDDGTSCTPEFYEGVRFAEKHHGIGGQQP